ncbi:ABC transporter permease [Bradyrhizobium sp. LVM 105]|uniref:ABC transporter permease n=1 Tax=Bradyrhizobium sp. LVM 105 TaxID=2341115 RepID=UPI000F7FD4B5|nr:ABC transporter permease [Bradyrhizobium sp. LVM 105]RTE94926.1 ABC transporter permease [Bradyrhizobium sp. LVM 105]
MSKKDLSLLVLILLVGTVVALINPRFLYVGNLSNTANQVGLFGIFSIAQAFVIIIGGIELSVGSVIALLGVLFIDLIVNRDVDWLVATAIIVAAGLVIGLVHGTLVTRMRIQAFVVTLCGLLIYRGAARYYTEDATAGFGFGASFPMLEWLAAGRTNVLGFPLPHSVVALGVVTIIAWVVLHRSVFGRYLYAVGKNEEAARYSGIRSSRVIISAYIICGGLTAFSAILIAMYTRSISPAVHGSFYELYAIAAAVLGGCSLRGGEGSIIGVVLGTVLLQMLQNLVNLLGIPSSLNFAVMGTVILAGVLGDQYLVQRRHRVGAAKGRGQASAAAVPIERMKVE